MYYYYCFYFINYLFCSKYTGQNTKQVKLTLENILFCSKYITYKFIRQQHFPYDGIAWYIDQNCYFKKNFFLNTTYLFFLSVVFCRALMKHCYKYIKKNVFDLIYPCMLSTSIYKKVLVAFINYLHLAFKYCQTVLH